MLKKIFALFVCAVLCFFALSLTTFAATSEETPVFTTFAKRTADKLSSPARYTGELGFAFTPTNEITVTALGAPALQGTTSTKVFLYEMKNALAKNTNIKATDLTKLAEAVITINDASKDSQGFNYAKLAVAIKLQKGKTYVLNMLVDKNTYNSFYELADGDVANKAINVLFPTYGLGGTDNTFATGADIHVDVVEKTKYGVPSFKFTQEITEVSSSAPAVSSIGSASSNQTISSSVNSKTELDNLDEVEIDRGTTIETPANDNNSFYTILLIAILTANVLLLIVMIVVLVLLLKKNK